MAVMFNGGRGLFLKLSYPLPSPLVIKPKHMLFPLKSTQNYIKASYGGDNRDRQIREKPKEAAERAKEALSSGAESAREKADIVKEKADDRAKSAASWAKETTNSAVEKAKNLGEEAKESAETTKEETKESAVNAKKKTEESAETALDKTKEGLGKVADMAGSVTEKAKETAKGVAESANQTTQKIKETVIGKAEDEENRRSQGIYPEYVNTASPQRKFLQSNCLQYSSPSLLQLVRLNYLEAFLPCPRQIMEKTKSTAKDISSAIEILQLDPPRNSAVSSIPALVAANEASDLPFRRKKKSRRLVSLCIGVLGQHLEDIIADISEIAAEFPADIKLVLLAIARRRQLLNDNVLVALAENLWEILDISGSDVTDVGLSKVSQICTNLRAVDISRCDKITVAGVTDLFHHCPSLATLRCGGSPRSEFTARRCLSFLKPKLDNVGGESWEELDSMDIGNGAQSLHWLVWPKIDEDSKLSLATECPRICVNPQRSIGVWGIRVPVEAMHSVALDRDVVEDIDPKTWAVSGISHAQKMAVASVEDEGSQMSIAEKFRLAFMERDARLAPKRAKNARQHRRRAEKELLMSSTSAKSLALASQAGKFLNNRS